MALLQKKPQISSDLPVYSIGNNRSLGVIGLGNIGKKYDNTRHNIGFWCIDEFASAHDFPDWEVSKKLHGDTTKQQLSDSNVILLKPATLMNNSGKSLAALLRYKNLDLSNCIVVHDDIDIPFGKIKTQIGGSAAGHNGIKSIIGQVGSDFARVRIGVGPKQPETIDSSDFVLAPFTKNEKQQLDNITKEATAIITEAIFANGNLASETRTAIF